MTRGLKSFEMNDLFSISCFSEGTREKIKAGSSIELSAFW